MSKIRTANRFFKRRFIICVLLTTAILLFMPVLTFAVDWIAATGDWSTAANWGGTMPDLYNDAIINNGGTALITQTGDGMCQRLRLGWYSTDSGIVQ